VSAQQEYAQVKYSSAEPLGKSLAGWTAREPFEVVEYAKERKSLAGTRVLTQEPILRQGRLGSGVSLRKPIPRGLAAGRRFGSDRAS
jgi:hypothetical protein